MMFETVPFDLVTFASVLAALFVGFVVSVAWRWLIVDVWQPWMETSPHTAKCLCGFKSRKPREMMSHIIAVHPGFDPEVRTSIFAQYKPGVMKDRK